MKDEATGELKLDPSAEAVTFDAKVDEGQDRGDGQKDGRKV